MKTIKEKKVKIIPTVKLIRYSVKAIIPTGAYANIQPEIVVEADTLEAAEKFVMPYMEKIFAKYREPQAVSAVSQSPVNAFEEVKASITTTATAINVETPTPTKKPTSPNTTVSFTRAFKAITNCMTVEAIDIIKNQIIKSVKLTDSEKAELAIVVETKLSELKQK